MKVGVRESVLSIAVFAGIIIALASVDPNSARAHERLRVWRRCRTSRQPRGRYRRRAMDGAAHAEHRERADGRLRHRGVCSRCSCAKQLMPIVLAIEPDLRQATILKRIIRDRVHGRLGGRRIAGRGAGRDRHRMPDVLLLSALLRLATKTN